MLDLPSLSSRAIELINEGMPLLAKAVFWVVLAYAVIKVLSALVKAVRG